MFDAVSNPLPPADRRVLLRGKQPFRSGWQHNPPSQAEVDKHLLAGGNLGCLTGRGLWVADFDDLRALDSIEADHGRLPGWRVRTGSGKLHIYMRGLPDQAPLRPKLDGGLDFELKADGTQVVWRGSVHPDTDCYYIAIDPDEWRRGELPSAPDWFVALVRRRTSSPGSGRRGGLHLDGVQGLPCELYLPRIFGIDPQPGGHFNCPAHLSVVGYEDQVASAKAYPDGHWTCYGCDTKMVRARGSLAISRGIGLRDLDGQWRMSDDDKRAIDTELREMFKDAL